MKTKITQNIKSIIVVLLLVVGVSYVSANFTAPLHTPPTCLTGEPGCDAPINVGGVLQSKTGTLNLADLIVANLKVTNSDGTTTGITAGQVLTAENSNGKVKWGNAGGGTGVSKIIAGDNITISPTNGIGDVTISAPIEYVPCQGSTQGSIAQCESLCSGGKHVIGGGCDGTVGSGGDSGVIKSTPNLGRTGWMCKVRGDSTVSTASGVAICI